LFCINLFDKGDFSPPVSEHCKKKDCYETALRQRQHTTHVTQSHFSDR